jgi:nucleotide-binding universal stress UspA family protein
MEKNILVAIDQSRPSTEILHYASRLAESLDELTFSLVHIQPVISTYLTEEARRKPSARRALETVVSENEKKATQLLESAAERLVSKGVDASAIQQMTIPRNVGVAKDILAYATAKMADAILVGRRGASQLKQWIVGSVTADLVEHSQVIPIWVVDGQNPSSEILLAVDGSQSALRALDHMAFMLSGTPDNSFHLLHVRPSFQDYCEIQLDDENAEAVQSVLLDEDQHCMDNFYSQAIAVLKKYGFDGNKAKWETLDGKLSIPRAIMQYAKDNGVGSIVVGRRGRGKGSFFGSVSRSIFQHAENMAFWVVP